jgi:hypothetical protein
MSFQVPTCEPDQITAGDTANWKRSFQNFPSSEGWTLSYAFALKGGENQAKQVTTTVDGIYFVVNTSTANWAPGDYYGQGYVSKGVAPNIERHQVWEGALTVRPNLAGANPGDIRTPARKILDAIEAVISKTATQQILKWNVEGVELERRQTTDLIKLRDKYKVIVQKEEMAARVRAGKASGRRILTKFSRPGFTNTFPPGFVRS